MLDGAAAGDPLKAASGISWSSRSKNMKDWLSKVGLDVSNAPTTEAALNVAAPSTAATFPAPLTPNFAKAPAPVSAAGIEPTISDP